MKAIILAAGYATRMYPLTENQPKPLLKVSEKPMLNYILEKIKNLPEIKEIFVVTNARFYDTFRVWLNSFTYPKKIRLINDGTVSKDDRLGAVGDINFILKEEDVNDDLLIIGGDNLFEDDLSGLMKSFREKGSTILLNEVKDKETAKRFGIVSLDPNKKITRFVEKPENPESTLAATLIYAIKKEDISLLGEAVKSGFADRTGDFIAYLSKKRSVYGKLISGKWFDIGSFESMSEANDYFKKKGK